MTVSARIVFLVAFAAALVFQGVMLLTTSIEDQTIWTTAAQTVRTKSADTFPALDAYMHPGGTVIEGNILVHAVTKSDYKTALNIFLMVFDSLSIATLCALCFVLRKSLWWPATMLAILLVQPLHADSSLYVDLTPPSLVATLIFPILCLFTLYLYEKKESPKWQLFVLWSALAGFLPATRIDIGGVMVALLLLFLTTKYSLKTVFLMGLGALAAFFVFDPFMWFAPVTQVAHLLSSVHGHYAGPVPGSIETGFATSVLYYFLNLQYFIALPTVSMLLALAFMILPKKLHTPIPARFLLFLLVSSVVVVGIFCTAQTQAARYIMPIVLLWEVLLPLFVFTLISQIEFSFVTTPKGQQVAQNVFKLLIVLLLIAQPAFLYVSEMVTYHGVSPHHSS